MKRLVSMILVALILSTSMVVFASMEEKLGNHWSKDFIEKDFLAYYFPYLAKESFTKLEPNGDISKRDFILSFASLFKDYDLDNTMMGDILGYEALDRKELVNIIGNKLIGIKTIKIENQELPFKDINTMDIESIELLKVLYNYKIIYGVSNTSFAPDKKLTQAEAIIILQRLKGVLEEMRRIEFNVTGIAQSFNLRESVTVNEDIDNVLVTITKEFPTPGYSMEVEKILRDKNEYKVYLNVTPPKADSILPQVITYKTMTVEIDKDQLMGPSPYVFTVDGIKSNLFTQ